MKSIRTGQQVLVKYGSMHILCSPCRLALTRTTETIRQRDKSKKQQDTQIPSKPNIDSKSGTVDASDSESYDENAHIETTNQSSQLNDQIEITRQSRLPTHVKHQQSRQTNKPQISKRHKQSQ